jgi:glycosyltransferase involved in cell wall biosynthesis
LGRIGGPNVTSPRVLYLCGWPIGAHGDGAVSFVYEQIDALSSDVQAVYVEHRFDGAVSWTRRRAARRDVEAISDLWPPPVVALRLWTPRLSPRLTKHGLMEDLWKAGAMVAERVTHAFGKIDLVHAHVVLPAGLLGASISRALGVPLVLQEHSAPFSMHLDTEEKRSAVRQSLAAAAVVCAVGDDLARRIDEQDAAHSIRLTPNLVRTGLFAPSAIPDDRSCLRLVTVGSLEERKGYDVLLDALAILQRSGQPMRLRILGAGSLQQALAARLSALGIDPSAALLGSCSRTQTASVIADSHIYVCASRHETFGIAPAEALSVGRPVVSTRCGGPEQFVDETCGAVVEPGDAQALADAILRTWQRIDTFAPAQMHAHVDEQFGPDAFRRRMLALYDEVCSARVAA